jgi:hypothetical protein
MANKSIIEPRLFLKEDLLTLQYVKIDKLKRNIIYYLIWDNIKIKSTLNRKKE